MNEGLQQLFEKDHNEACQRLEKFLVEEFPLEVTEGDNMLDLAIRLMKDMKGQLGRLNAGNAVFPERF